MKTLMLTRWPDLLVKVDICRRRHSSIFQPLTCDANSTAPVGVATANYLLLGDYRKDPGLQFLKMEEWKTRGGSLVLCPSDPSDPSDPLRPPPTPSFTERRSLVLESHAIIAGLLALGPGAGPRLITLMAFVYSIETHLSKVTGPVVR
jgi:hypothetical protein